MNKKPTITAVQLILMSVGSGLMFPYTFLPILNTKPLNQDVCIVIFFVLVYIILMSAPMLFLISHFRGLRLHDIFTMICGRWAGKILISTLIIIFWFCQTACMLVGAKFVRIELMPDTPGWAFMLYAAIPIVYLSYKGPGVIGRISAFIVPFIMLTIIVFFLMGIEMMDINILRPLLADSTFLELNEGGFLTAARYSEILVFLIFSCFLLPKVNVRRTFLKAIGIFGVMFSLILVPTVLVLGLDMARNAFNPYFVYTRQVHGYDFIQRVQAFNTLAWFPGMILKLSLYNHMASHVMADVIQARSHKPFVAPLMLTGYLFGLIPMMNDTHLLLLLISDEVFPWVILPFTVVIPLILTVVYFFRRKTVSVLLAKHPDKVEEP